MYTLHQCTFLIPALTLFSMLPPADLQQEETVDPIAVLEQAISGDPKPSEDAMDSLSFALQDDPAAYGPILLEKISQPDLTQDALSYYLWGLALAPCAQAVGKLAALADPEQPDAIFYSAVAALGATEADAAGKHLVRLLDLVEGDEKTFGLLSALGQMKYSPALPKTVGILRKDPRDYWQSVSVFGKYGDVAVPFLLKQLRAENADKNTKSNALMILGMWLGASEATEPLKQMFLQEQDTDVRMMILSALSGTIRDFGDQTQFLEEVVTKEQVGPVKQFAERVLGQIPRIQKRMEDQAGERQPDAEVFRQEYRILYRSAGRKGDIERLGKASSPENEDELKRLRERVLTRGSDECFREYKRISLIIGTNGQIMSRDK